jgi:hypothetical protein
MATGRTRSARKRTTLLLAWVGLYAVMAALAGCGWQPDKPFERNAPAVDDAIEALDAGEAGAAASLLQGYLETGECKEGNIGVSGLVRERTHASFDLGLTLFELAQKLGPRFGAEQSAAGDGGLTPEQQTETQLRSDHVECALRLLQAIAISGEVPAELVARARYLEGNLEFLRRNYRGAVSAYDEALRLIPGLPEDAGDGIGRDAAWNRAIALRRIEEENKRDAGQDASDEQDASQDTTPDQDAGSPEGGEDGPKETGDEANQDASRPDAGNDGGGDGGDRGEGGADGGDDGRAPQDQNKQPDGGAPDGGQQPPPTTATQDDRMLDMLESAPTVQLQDAKNRATRRRARGMIDK